MIKKCNKCGLCKHQLPLVDKFCDCQIFWVGLSAKITLDSEEGPLSPTTNSGNLLCKVEERCANISTYRTNIVKCAPLNEKGKLRYPNKKEINVCLPHFDDEIECLSPRIVFLLGNKVTEAVSKKYSINFKKWNNFNYEFQKYKDLYFVSIHHPSYVYVYKRKYISEYIDGIENVIKKLL